MLETRMAGLVHSNLVPKYDSMKQLAFIVATFILLLSQKSANAQVYSLGNSAATPGWYKLGRLTLAQGGREAEIRISGGAGYTAIFDQLGECYIHFRTSNGDVQVNGFYGSGGYDLTGRSKIVSAVKVVQITTSTWDFYAILPIYTGDGANLSLTSKDGTWAPGFSLSSPPSSGVTYMDLTNEKYLRNNVYFSENVGIGTITPAEKLSVNGKIRAQEIKVESANWPDFVFEKDYKLPSLSQTEKHILEKGHLPGIPSAKEVEANGVELGEMNKKLLQKIEELTLYLIEMKKDNEQQREQLQTQGELINKILKKYK